MKILKNLRVSLRGLKKFLKMSEIEELVNGFGNIKIKNRGTGAGGAKTNANGKTFEDLTNNESRLIAGGYTKTVFKNSTFGYYLTNGETVFVLQDGFKSYMKMTYDIDISFKPDEAYITTREGKTTIKILEKKNQNVTGSVDTKLYAGYGLKCTYEYICGEDFKIEYAFCLSDYFKENRERYIYTNMFNREHGIEILYADDDYFENLDKWIA
jgi:hypothetical protein